MQNLFYDLINNVLEGFIALFEIPIGMIKLNI